MVGRGRGRGLAQMHRDIQNLKRQVEELMNIMENQRLKQREDNSDEGDTDQSEEFEEEPVNHGNFEERMLSALEGKNEGIKVEVSEYASSLKPEELIDWLNEMEKFFEWKSMTEEKR
ncbi:hypothetical protein SUGI_0479400 [Cryptomeria japonica]|nr:hypothetical protein SUGI_0479400 [Cryptomeria japonica]